MKKHSCILTIAATVLFSCNSNKDSSKPLSTSGSQTTETSTSTTTSSTTETITTSTTISSSTVTTTTSNSTTVESSSTNATSITSSNTLVATPTCVSDSSPVFSHNLLSDLTLITGIVPPGSAQSHEIKPHGYVRLKSGTSYPIYAPVDSKLELLAYYTEGTTAEEHLLIFRVSCEVTYRMDHIVNAVTKIIDASPSSISEDTQTTPPKTSVSFKAGDLIGYSNAETGGFDFGVYNTKQSNSFVKHSRYGSNNINSVCPFDYFSLENKSVYYSDFATLANTLVPNSECRSADQDVKGTLSGGWFLDSGSTFTYPSSFGIAADFDGSVRVAGLGNLTILDQSSPPNPASVTTEACYSGGGHYVFLKVLPNDQLGASFGSGNCPGGTFDNLTDYEIYSR